MTDAVAEDKFDVVVAGAGPAGLVTALALASQGVSVTLAAPPISDAGARADTRTTALFGGSIELLRHIGVWAELEATAGPLVGLRLVDDTGGLLRAPETTFRASEVGRPCFGYNIENTALTRALAHRVAAQGPLIGWRRGVVEQVLPQSDTIEVICAPPTRALTAQLVVGADGRQSVCRSAAGIAIERWSYPQSALAVRFAHTRSHDGISTEFHRRAGPFTTVPLRGSWSSLVWVDTAAEVARLQHLADTPFAIALEDRLQGLLGSVSDVGPRSVFPLSGLSVTAMAKDRVALVGEAAHVIPPIGAQGLNLGFRDAAWIADLVGAAKRQGDDIGGSSVLEAYDRARRADVASRTLAVDLLNRSLFMDLLPLDVLRGAGIAALAALPWLRRRVMQEGLTPGAQDLPALLRPATQMPAS